MLYWEELFRYSIFLTYTPTHTHTHTHTLTHTHSHTHTPHTHSHTHTHTHTHTHAYTNVISMRVCACFRAWRFSRSQRLEVEVEVEVRDWQIKAFPKRHAQNDEQTLIEITSRFSRSQHLVWWCIITMTTVGFAIWKRTQCILQTLCYVQLVACNHPTLSVCKVTRINADISKLMCSTISFPSSHIHSRIVKMLHFPH